MDQEPIMPRPVYRWQTWPGRNTFYCNGKYMQGNDAAMFWMTEFLLIVPAIFYTYDLLLWSPALWLPGFVLFVFTSWQHCRASFTDPGIIPRNTSGVRPDQPDVDEAIDGAGVALKFCETCQFWRPPRAKHCRTCDNCVHAFDHHCPWVGNCVGKRNYRHFCFFVFGVTFLSLYIFGHCCLFLSRVPSSEMHKHTRVYGMAAFGIIIFLTVVALCNYHVSLLCSGMTTNEDITRAFRGRTNPYSKGWRQNWYNALWGPQTPSLLAHIDFSALDDGGEGATATAGNVEAVALPAAGADIETGNGRGGSANVSRAQSNKASTSAASASAPLPSSSSASSSSSSVSASGGVEVVVVRDFETGGGSFEPEPSRLDALDDEDDD